MASEYKLKGVTSLSDFGPGDKREVEVEGIQDAKVLLANTGGKVTALGPKCTHYGAPLVNGVLTKSGRLTCPWHGACFNGKTGDIENAPGLDSLATFKLIEKDGGVYVEGEEATIKSGRRKPKFKCTATSASADKVVIVGGGSGAIGTVEALREQGFTGAVTIITNEGYLPIDRPKLSKALIDDETKIQLRDDDWFKLGSVQIVNDEVIDVDLNAKTVTTKSQGGKHEYTKLVLATGGTPRNLPMQGFKVLENIFVLRNVHHAKKIVAAIGNKGKKIVIVGSSFIGMEVAGATAADNEVHVIGMEKVPLERVLGAQVGAGVQKLFEAKGVIFHASAGVEKAEPHDSDPSKVGAVVLKDGTRLEADLVILGVGVSPATEYLRDNNVIRLEQDGSLKVDDTFLVHGVKDVYAIGDIASFPYHGPGGNGSYARIEHWNVAQNQGRIVARHIVNPSLKPTFFTPIFWSALTAQLRYCGNPVNGWDDLVLQGNPEEGKFVSYYCKGETVVAMASMGKDPAMVKVAELMAEGKMPGKKELQDGLDILDVSIAA